MGPESTLYFVILVVIGSVSTILGLIALKKPDVAGSRPFSAFMLCVAFWSFAYGMEFQFAETATMLLSTKLAFIGIVFVPVFWVWFVLEYTGREKYLKSGKLFLLFIIPAITLILLFTNEFHYLFYSAIYTAGPDGELILIGEYGPWYIVHTVYSYALLICSTFFLIKVYYESPAYYRPQIAMVLSGVLIPWIGNFVYITGVVPNLVFDITPFLFLLSGIIFYVGIFRYPNFKIMPIAKDTIIEVMTDGVFVLDKNNLIVDANPAAIKYAGNQAGIVGKNISDLFPDIDDFFGDSSSISGSANTLEVRNDDGLFYYNIVISPLFPDDKNGGHLLIVRDITGQKMAEKEIYLSKERYKNLYNNISDGILLHKFADKGVLGKIIDANDVALKMLGFSAGELYGMDGDEIQSAIVCEYDVNRYHKLKDSGSLRYETSFVRKDLQVIPVYLNSRLICLDNEEVVLSLVKNITVEKEARELERKSLM